MGDLAGHCNIYNYNIYIIYIYIYIYGCMCVGIGLCVGVMHALCVYASLCGHVCCELLGGLYLSGLQ